MNNLLVLAILAVLFGVPLYAVFDKKRRQLILLCWLLCILVPGGVVAILSEKENKPENKPEKSRTEASTVDLNASVRFTGTQFVVSNNDAFDWTNLELEINSGLVSSGFVLRTQRMRTGGTYTVGAAQFAKPDGKRFNPVEFKPQNLSIRCNTPSGRGVYYGTWR